MGKVPEHWEIKRLKHIADIRLSNVDKHTVEGQKVVRLCNYLDVYNNRRITSKVDFMTATASDEQITRLSVRKDDVIITKDSEDPSDIGIPALVAEDIFGLVCGYHLAILRPTASNGEFLHYFLQSIFVRSAFEVEATGMTRYALGKYSIENLIFVTPPLTEQQSIATFLDQETSRIDTLISEKERLSSLLQEYRQALISHAVTKGLDPNVKMEDSGVEWLGEIPKHWEVLKLKYLATICGGGTPSKLKQEFWEGDLPWVSPKDLKSNTIDDTEDHITKEAVLESSTQIIPSQTVLIVVRSGILQHTIPIAINTVPVALNQDMKAILFNEMINPLYFLYLVTGLESLLLLEWRKKGPTVESIESEYLLNTFIPVPPIFEQNSIAATLLEKTSRIDTLIFEAKKFIELLKEYRSSLISAAVTGKINVFDKSGSL